MLAQPARNLLLSDTYFTAVTVFSPFRSSADFEIFFFPTSSQDKLLPRSQGAVGLPTENRAPADHWNLNPVFLNEHLCILLVGFGGSVVRVAMGCP